jgi:hypothetical protein
MKCVDLSLNPAPQPRDWSDFQKCELVCTSCLKIFHSKNDELFFFPEVDYFFHKHPDRSFYRALLLTDDGNIRIAAGDSETENVLQLMAINLDGLGDFKNRFATLDDLRNAARRFFQAMRAQNRDFEKGTFYLGSDGTMHIS